MGYVMSPEIDDSRADDFDFGGPADWGVRDDEWSDAEVAAMVEAEQKAERENEEEWSRSPVVQLMLHPTYQRMLEILGAAGESLMRKRWVIFGRAFQVDPDYRRLAERLLPELRSETTLQRYQIATCSREIVSFALSVSAERLWML
jgi:hypothetical protein